MATTLTGHYAQETTDAVIPMATQAVYNRSLLKRALPLLVHMRYGQQRPLKRRSGKSMVFRRYSALAKSNIPVTEAVTPSGVDLTKSEVVATINQYINFTTLSDMIVLAGFDPIINEASQLMGENMGLSLDTVYREIINAGTVFRRTLTSSTSGVGAITTVAVGLAKWHIDQAINILDRANAKKFTSMVPASTGVATAPLGPAYRCIIHPDVTRDLFSNGISGLTVGNQFTPVEQYSAQSQVEAGEVGKYRNVRFIESTESKIQLGVGSDTVGTYRATDLGTNRIDVYSCLFLAKDFYGVVPLDGGNSRTIIHRAGSTSDPGNQRSTVAYKAATTAVILNDNFAVRVECAATA